MFSQSICIEEAVKCFSTIAFQSLQIISMSHSLRRGNISSAKSPCQSVQSDMNRNFSLSLRYPDHEDQISNPVISDISVLLRKTTLNISYSIETGSSIETE